MRKDNAQDTRLTNIEIAEQNLKQRRHLLKEQNDAVQKKRSEMKERQERVKARVRQQAEANLFRLKQNSIQRIKRAEAVRDQNEADCIQKIDRITRKMKTAEKRLLTRLADRDRALKKKAKQNNKDRDRRELVQKMREEKAQSFMNKIKEKYKKTESRLDEKKQSLECELKLKGEIRKLLDLRKSMHERKTKRATKHLETRINRIDQELFSRMQRETNLKNNLTKLKKDNTVKLGLRAHEMSEKLRALDLLTAKKADLERMFGKGVAQHLKLTREK